MRDPYIDITQGIGGWFCVLLTWNEDNGGFYEPWTTSPARYSHPEAAIDEALVWAQNEEIRCAFYGPVQELQEEVE